jgi:acyl carrier protein
MYDEIIINWIIKHKSFESNEIQISYDEDLFYNGLLDSIAFLMLLAHLEKDFNISFDFNQLDNKKLTINTLTRSLKKT